MKKLTVGLFNDSFPPSIDGVANAVINYARCIEEKHGHAAVATPRYPNTPDASYTFAVVRYPYRVGYPYHPRTVRRLERMDLDIIHCHCPFASAVLARAVGRICHIPIVFTYHTKYDIDIKNVISSKLLRTAAIKFIVKNIEACDEVWVVSEGAGENLRSLGYKGSYILMENGVDLSRGRASREQIRELEDKYSLSPDETVFLFVGRMMWYKGIRLSLDGLAAAKSAGCSFKMFFIGDGADLPEIKKYAAQLGLEKDCIFTGAVTDRELLRVFYSRARLFLFPSTFDTNGIVVREAAACGCPSLMIRGSCASEGITDGRTGILIEENISSMSEQIILACKEPERLRAIGERASEEIYISWSDAVDKAYARYETVLSRYHGLHPASESSVGSRNGKK